MLIQDFKRNEKNEVVAIMQTGEEIVLSNEYVAENAPQIGDEYPKVDSEQKEPEQSKKSK